MLTICANFAKVFLKILRSVIIVLYNHFECFNLKQFICGCRSEAVVLAGGCRQQDYGVQLQRHPGGGGGVP